VGDLAEGSLLQCRRRGIEGNAREARQRQRADDVVRFEPLPVAAGDDHPVIGARHGRNLAAGQWPRLQRAGEFPDVVARAEDEALRRAVAGRRAAPRVPQRPQRRGAIETRAVGSDVHQLQRRRRCSELPQVVGKRERVVLAELRARPRLGVRQRVVGHQVAGQQPVRRDLALALRQLRQRIAPVALQHLATVPVEQRSRAAAPVRHLALRVAVAAGAGLRAVAERRRADADAVLSGHRQHARVGGAERRAALFRKARQVGARVQPATQPVAGFEHRDAAALRLEEQRRAHAREAGTEDQDVGTLAGEGGKRPGKGRGRGALREQAKEPAAAVLDRWHGGSPWALPPSVAPRRGYSFQ